MKTILCGLTLLCAGAVQASIITYDYYATITSLHGPLEPNFGGLGVGDTLAGSFSYDAGAINQGNATFGAYDFLNLSLQAGALTHSLTTPGLQIDLANEYMWELGGQSANHDFGLSIKLGDTVAPYVQTDTQLRPPPDPATVDTHQGFLVFFHSPEPNIAYLNFNIDRVVKHSSSVPDAGSTFELLAGALGLMTCWQFKSRQYDCRRIGHLSARVETDA